MTGTNEQDNGKVWAKVTFTDPTGTGRIREGVILKDDGDVIEIETLRGERFSIRATAATSVNRKPFDPERAKRNKALLGVDENRPFTPEE